MSTQDVREEALLNTCIKCVVKGYHLWRFEVNASEVLTAKIEEKKRGERGNAFKVNHRGQLGHIQSELVD